ncbi:hypothetical protein PROFUN_15816 [Planoprotostelium fungivorum]|uniref:Uncharacterized protein n=1 Tax=Planoprotostelium fungivorum TaxID=1890364 RepID=A0A2P6MU98_9EUKA|nr:hypothetical protein PROFUN_15816 [Planoprotostelium fungivorum]
MGQYQECCDRTLARLYSTNCLTSSPNELRICFGWQDFEKQNGSTSAPRTEILPLYASDHMSRKDYLNYAAIFSFFFVSSPLDCRVQRYQLASNGLLTQERPEHLEICTDGSLYKGIASYGVAVIGHDLTIYSDSFNSVLFCTKGRVGKGNKEADRLASMETNQSLKI